MDRDPTMTEPITVLLVHLGREDMTVLEAGVVRRPAEVRHAQSCREAAGILADADPPNLVFTDTKLPDGSWADVIASAGKAAVPVNVIVVARLVDTRFYIEAIEAGAYDFIAPPFRPDEFDHVIQCAAQNVWERREAQARVEHAAQKELFPTWLNPGAPETSRPQPPATEPTHKTV
jgi:DNA-binding NtrC family response regulator